jgi:integrase
MENTNYPSNELLLNELAKILKIRSFESGTIESHTSPVTINKFENEYLNYILKNRSFSYYRSNKLALKHLKEYWGEKQFLHEISYKNWEDYLTFLRNQCKGGVHVYYRNYRAALNKAVKWKYISENPLGEIKLPKRQTRSPQFLDKEDLRRLKKFLLPHINDIVSFAYYTGMRRNEIIMLEWHSIDMEKEIISVGSDSFQTKSRKHRFIPMHNEVIKILKRWNKIACKNSDIVFHKGNGFPYSKDYISKRFKRAVRNAGLSESLKFHSLRASTASNLSAQGVSPAVIREILGHSSISTTMIYVGVEMKTMRESILRLK